MNGSVTEPDPEGDLNLLLDEVESLMFRFARLLGSHAADDPEALSPPQYIVLRALQKAGAMRVTDVAAHLGVTNPAASMLLHAMTEEGLIDRETDADDRRVSLVSVSASGEERLGRAEEVRRRFMRRVTAALEPEELRAMIKGLNELADALAAERP